MIVLLPNTSTQTISVMPRLSSFTSDVNVNIRRDGDGIEEDLLNVTTLANGNFTDISFSSTILKEGSTYFMEVTHGADLIYRDKIFSTSQVNYKIKHIVSQDIYEQYSVTDDNTYIV